MGRVKALTKDAIAAALYKGFGIVAVAARELGVSRSRLSNRIHADPALLAELEGAREDLCDRLRWAIIRGALKGDTRLLMFAAERLMPDFRPPQMQTNVTVNNIQRPDDAAIEKAKAIFEEMRRASLGDDP